MNEPTHIAKTATFVKNMEGWRGDARLYQLSEPYICENEFSKDIVPYEQFIVSAADVPYSGPETYIFGAVDGNADDMIELAGSFQGGLDHDRAIRDAGYEPVYPKGA